MKIVILKDIRTSADELLTLIVDIGVTFQCFDGPAVGEALEFS